MKDFQTVTAAAADRIGGFFAGLRTRITERTDEGDGARIARILRRFFATVAPAAFAALLGSVRLPLSTYPLGLAAVAAGVGDTPALAVGVLLGALGVYDKLIGIAGCGATLPLCGFGASIARGMKTAVAEYGVLGVFKGGFTAAAAGTSAALIFGYLAALLFRGKPKK